MFDWFFNFLYSITKGILNLIDMVMEVCLKLIGINGVEIDGEDQDLLTFLFGNERVRYAFAIASILAFILMMIVTIFAIVRTIGKEKVEDTPLGICKKCFMNIFVLLLVPAFMFIFTVVCNAFMKAMYQGLMGDATTKISDHLFATFAQNSSSYSYSKLVTVNWHSTGTVRDYCDLNDFDFIYSWIVGIAILVALGLSTLSLVERLISIVILYIAAPFTVATSVIDDGQRFKAWREQVLSKYLVCYGMLVGLVVYMMVAGIVCSERVKFFASDSLNYFAKAIFLLGGAVSLKAIQAVVGNLVSAGAGDKAMQEQGQAAHGFAGAMRRMGRVATAPFRATRSAVNFGRDAAHYGIGSTIGQRLGFKTDWDYKRDFALKGDKNANGEPSGNKNSATPTATNGNTVSNAIAGDNKNPNQASNKNEASVRQDANKGKNMVNNAISDALNQNNEKVK